MNGLRVSVSAKMHAARHPARDERDLAAVAVGEVAELPEREPGESGGQQGTAAP